MKSDIEIAREAKLLPIWEVGEKVGLSRDDLELHTDYMAKIKMDVLKRPIRKDAKVVLVTAMTPTKLGEGKTTVAVGLSQAMWRIGKTAIVNLREPSLGPVFGIKGGATGGGYAQVLPMEDINLHFTGDFHAVTYAHNLLAAMLDAHLHFGNELGFHIKRIEWGRALDLNERALRHIIVGLGGPGDGVPRESHFVITAASEIMAILGLVTSYRELKEALSRIVVGWTRKREPIVAGKLGAVGAMAALLKHALKPNLVQTIENTPAIVHTGPFANIAHGTSSLMGVEVSRRLAEYTIIEAGFGSDLGAEKFIDIVARKGGFRVDAAVIVATIRALKVHGGVPLEEVKQENVEAVRKGYENLQKHIENLRIFGVPAVVAINRFPTDTEAEIRALEELLEQEGVPYSLVEVHSRGGEGGIDLAEKVVKLAESGNSDMKFLYELDEDLKTKIEKISKAMYGAEGVDFTDEARKKLRLYERRGYGGLYINMAKTQYSLSDNPKVLGRPRNFRVKVTDAVLLAGAGFVVPILGGINLMPGLPRHPNALDITMDDEGNIEGLF